MSREIASSASPSEIPSEPVTMSQLNQILNQLQSGLTQHISQAVAQHVASIPASSSSSSSASSHPPPPIPLHSSSLSSKVKISPPSNFTGTRSVNVDAWLFEMVSYLDVCSVPDAQRLSVASSYLKDAALQWWLGQSRLPDGERPRNWVTFTAALRERFQPLAASRTARAQLRALRQGNMSVAEYSNKFYTLVNLITDMGEADQIETFTSGLRPSLAREVDLREPRTLQSAMTSAQKVELLLENRNSYASTTTTSIRPSGYVPTPSASSTTPASTPMELGNVNIESEEQFIDEIQQEYEQYLIHGDEYQPSYEDWSDGNQIEENEEAKEEAEQLQAIQRGNPTGNRHSAPFLSKEEFTRCMKEGLCLRCKQPGHVARNCSLPRPPPRNPRRFNPRPNFSTPRRF